MLKDWSKRLVLDRETYFVRHAQNFPKRHVDDIDTALTPQGFEQARAVGEFFLERGIGKSVLILYADLHRTKQTAEEIAKVLKPEILPFVSLEITQFPLMGDAGMDQEIERVNQCFGGFRGYLEIILQRECPGYGFSALKPLIVVTQAPAIARIMGLDPKELPYACVYQYPTPNGIPKNLVESLIH